MIVRAQFPDLFLLDMLPALDEVIFNKYDSLPEQFSRFFDVRTSTRAMEQTTQLSGLGRFGPVPEAGPVSYDQPVPGFDKTYLHVQYGLGFKASRILADDDRFGIIKKMATELAASARDTVELVAADIYNQGWSGANGLDGVPLFSLSHPLVKAGGVQANKPAAAMDLSHTNVQLALTAFRKMVNSAGRKVRVKPTRLVVPPELEFAAAEIITATMRSDTANNTPNAMKARSGSSPFNRYEVYDFLTDPDKWIVAAEPEDTELRFYWREKPAPVHDVDFDSRTLKTAMWMRFSVGWSGYEGLYGVG